MTDGSAQAYWVVDARKAEDSTRTAEVQESRDSHAYNDIGCSIARTFFRSVGIKLEPINFIDHLQLISSEGTLCNDQTLFVNHNLQTLSKWNPSSTTSMPAE
jgi:hypothetical protein